MKGDASTAQTKSATPASKPGLLAEEQAWRNGEGKIITAAVKQVSESYVTFVLPGGKTVDYPLAKLSEESRVKLRDLTK